MRKVDVVVVGAGAAGLMAAITAATEGARTILVDRRHKIGAKILISGGTRCNVTNDVVAEKHFNTPSLPFVRNVLRQLSPEQTRDFFEANGCPLKLEPTGKYFPVSDSARDVLAALTRALESSGAELLREAIVTSVGTENDRLVVETDQTPIECQSVVLCTGGLSFPETGSDGVGYEIATSLGHSIVRTSPALTPLLASNPVHAELSGVTIPATLTLWVNGKKSVEFTGSTLFTHTGYSGPAALNVSRHWVREQWDSRVELRANWVPERGRTVLESEWIAEATRSPKRRVANLVATWVPARLAARVLRSSGAHPELILGEASKEARRRTLDELTEAVLPVTDVHGYGKAEVTAGGVSLREIVASSLESKIVPGIFFAGEILDVDGFLGGYNFQWAWSSGFVAGRAAARRVL